MKNMKNGNQNSTPVVTFVFFIILVVLGPAEGFGEKFQKVIMFFFENSRNGFRKSFFPKKKVNTSTPSRFSIMSQKIFSKFCLSCLMPLECTFKIFRPNNHY